MEQISVLGTSGRTIRAVAPLAGHKLLLEFDNGEKRVYDVTPLLKFDAFKPLADDAFFRRVHVIFDYTIGWSDGMDICPDCLYEHSAPV